MQQYLFWAAVVFAILVFILLLVVLFYPKSKGTFVLKQKDGTLTLDKKAIEGLVRSQLHEEEFVGSPKVKIRSTKNKINVHVKGDLKRTSSLVGKTSALMREIEQKVRNVLGTEQNIGVAVTYSGYEEQNTRDNKHSRVDRRDLNERIIFNIQAPDYFRGTWVTTSYLMAYSRLF